MKYEMVYYHNTDNLGDDILSYSGKQFLPHVDYYIDRESLDVFLPETKEYVATILNGWYLHYHYTFQPSPYLIPLFIGTHFSKDQKIFNDYSYLDGNVSDYLQQHAPIGCRDLHTMEVLKQKAIDSYFSGCLTLTLKKFPDVTPNHSIVLTDVSDEVLSYIRELFPDKNIVCKTHKLEPQEVGLSWSQREQRLEEYLKLYQGADLVITTRLHCALPSVALETPVIFLGKYDTDFYERLSSFSDFFTCCNETELLAGKINDMLLHPTKNTNSLPLRNSMIERCNQFINTVDNQTPDCSLLPDCSLYRSLYIDRTQHMRNSLYHMLEIRQELENQIQKDASTLERVLAISNSLLAENDRLQKELENLSSHS